MELLMKSKINQLTAMPASEPEMVADADKALYRQDTQAGTQSSALVIALGGNITLFKIDSFHYRLAECIVVLEQCNSSVLQAFHVLATLSCSSVGCAPVAVPFKCCTGKLNLFAHKHTFTCTCWCTDEWSRRSYRGPGTDMKTSQVLFKNAIKQ